jgi:hypothetical protein
MACGSPKVDFWLWLLRYRRQSVRLSWNQSLTTHLTRPSTYYVAPSCVGSLGQPDLGLRMIAFQIPDDLREVRHHGRHFHLSKSAPIIGSDCHGRLGKLTDRRLRALSGGIENEERGRPALQLEIESVPGLTSGAFIAYPGSFEDCVSSQMK